MYILIFRWKYILSSSTKHTNRVAEYFQLIKKLNHPSLFWGQETGPASYFIFDAELTEPCPEMLWD